MLAFFLFFYSTGVSAAKSRRWLGPNNFLEGQYPTIRYGHGFQYVEGRFYSLLGQGLSPSGNYGADFEQN